MTKKERRFWKAPSEAAGGSAPDDGAAWFFGSDKLEPPSRPHRVKLVDEDGKVREVYVPPGRIEHWP